MMKRTKEQKNKRIKNFKPPSKKRSQRKRKGLRITNSDGFLGRNASCPIFFCVALALFYLCGVNPFSFAFFIYSFQIIHDG
jgi:hypothetical protein